MIEFINRYDRYAGLLNPFRCKANIYNNFLNMYFLLNIRSPGIYGVKNKNILDVSIFYIIYCYYQIHLRFFCYRSMIIQFVIIQLWSSIIRTQPGMLLLQKASLANRLSLGKCMQGQTFQIDLPKHILLDDLLDTVYYHNIKLFYLKDPDSKYDVLCAIIKFCNLKGWPEGTDG